MAANKVTLTVCGSSYTISTADPEDYILNLAERLNKDMTQLMVESPSASVTTAAILTALSYLDETEKSTSGADNMRAQIQGYLEDASRARLAAEDAKKEVQRLKNELKACQSTTKRPQKQQTTLLDYGQDDTDEEAKEPKEE